MSYITKTIRSTSGKEILRIFVLYAVGQRRDTAAVSIPCSRFLRRYYSPLVHQAKQLRSLNTQGTEACFHAGPVPFLIRSPLTVSNAKIRQCRGEVRNSEK